MQIFQLGRTALRLLSLALGFVWGGGVAAADPAMWVVRDADSTVYLLGTMHLVKPGVNWRSEKLDAALKSSDQFWMEANDDPAVVQTYALNFGMDSRKPLESSVGEENFAKFVRLAERYQIPTRDLHQMRPWLASLVISRAQMLSLGYDPELGVDRTLQKEAIAAGKAVIPLETTAEQLGYLADLPDTISAQMFAETLEDAEDGGKILDAMLDAWLAGDAKALHKVAVSRMRKEAPAVYDAMLVRRNNNWVKRIETLLEGSGTQFIAVGAAHLLGEDGLPDQLARRGYKVERY